MVKDDSLYIIAMVAVVAVVGLVIMATGSTSTVMVSGDLPSMAEDSDSTAIAGQAYYKTANTVKISSGSTDSLIDRGYGLTQEIAKFRDVTEGESQITSGTAEIMGQSGEFGVFSDQDTALQIEINQILEKHGITPIDVLSVELASLHQSCDSQR